MSLSQGLAYIVAICLIVLPPVVCWQYGPSVILGSHPIIKLLLIGGVGGVIAFALGLKKEERVAGAICGLFIGSGAVSGLVLYTALFDRLSLSKGEIILAEFIGALPGFLLLQWLTRKTSPTGSSNPNHPEQQPASEVTGS